MVPGLEPVSPALAGGFLIAVPLGKPLTLDLVPGILPRVGQHFPGAVLSVGWVVALELKLISRPVTVPR